MKKCRILFLTVVVAGILCGCGSHGKVNNVRKDIGPSNVYSSTEIGEAMDVVIAHFRHHFGGCTLTEITYEEERTEKAAAGWADQYDAEEAVVLMSSFEVGMFGGGSLNPNSTYEDWQWILTRDGGNWTLQTWGYG